MVFPSSNSGERINGDLTEIHTTWHTETLPPVLPAVRGWPLVPEQASLPHWVCPASLWVWSSGSWGHPRTSLRHPGCHLVPSGGCDRCPGCPWTAVSAHRAFAEHLRKKENTQVKHWCNVWWVGLEQKSKYELISRWMDKTKFTARWPYFYHLKE